MFGEITMWDTEKVIDDRGLMRNKRESFVENVPRLRGWKE